MTLALLPWPLHPAAGWPWVGSPIALWAALEGAFLLPALVGLLAPSTLAARAAVREAQMSLAGRLVCWLALGAGLWGVAGWTLLSCRGGCCSAWRRWRPCPPRLASARSARSAASRPRARRGLDEATTGLVRFARSARGGALLAALAVASLPPTGGSIRPALALAVALALFALTALLLRRAGALLPRLTLPAALRWCWWRALPIAVVGLVYLAIV